MGRLARFIRFYTEDDEGNKPEPGIWKTVTGWIIHITDALAAPVKKLEVNLEVVQNLHGYDNPWPAGGGKNILDPDERTTTSQNIYFYKNSGFLLKANQPYTFTVYSAENCAGLYVHEFPSNEYLKTAYNVKTTTYTPAEDVEVWFEAYYTPAPAQSTSEIKCQLELGSQSTPWSPYENICPIGYWNGCDVTWTGKNLFDPNSDFPLVDCYDYAVTAQIRRGVIYFLPAGTYTITASGDTGAYLNANVLNEDGSFNSFYSIVNGSTKYTRTATLTDGQYIVIYDQQATTASTATKFGNFDIQLEHGSTATDYEPYQGNIYSVDFPAMGHNQWDEEWVVGAITNGGVIDTTSSRRTTSFIPTLPNTEYRQVAPANALNGRVAYYDSDKNCISYDVTNGVGATFTTPANCYYVRITFSSGYGTTYNHDISINYPSTFTTYEPYYCVYGGTVDLVSGVLTVTYFLYTVTKNTSLSTGSGYNKTNTTDRYTTVNNAVRNGYTVDSKAKSDILKYVFNKAIWLEDNQSCFNTFTLNSRQLHMNFENATVGIESSDDGTTRTAKIKAWLENNPITFAIPLETPTEIQLTPQEISTLKGENNVWSNSNGETTLIYKAQAE